MLSSENSKVRVGDFVLAARGESLTASAGQRAVALDVLRVLAIVMVFTFHFPKPDGIAIFGSVGRFGWMGVDLFFVLSGYLIGTQIMKRSRLGRFSFLTFYWSRAIRTLPIYFAVLIIYLVFPGFREKPTIAPLWRFLTFTQNFEALRTAFSHAWSLCLEEQFYFVCPIVILILARMKKMRATLIALAAVVFAGVLFRHFTWLRLRAQMTPESEWDLYLQMIYYPTWGRLDGLALGVGVAALKEYRPQFWAAISNRRAPVFGAAVALLSLAVFLFGDRLSWSGTVLGYPVLALGFTALLIFAATSTSRLAWLRTIGVGQVAILSYSFYLVHKQVMHLLSANWSFAHTVSGQAVFATLSFAASLAAAFVMYQLIERPFLLLRDRWMREVRMTSSLQKPV